MVSLTETSAGFECVVCAVEDHVATITLNRPDRRNALNYRAYDELEQAFRLATADPEVRCVIVTGTDPAFCSGDDVGEIAKDPLLVAEWWIDEVGDHDLVHRTYFPVVSRSLESTR